MKTLLIATIILLTFKTFSQESFTFSANNIFVRDNIMNNEKTLAEETNIEFDEQLNVLTITTFPLVKVGNSPKLIECYQVWHINEIKRSLGRKAVFLYAGDSEEQCTEQFRIEWNNGQILSVTHITKAAVEDEAAVVRIYDNIVKEFRN